MGAPKPCQFAAVDGWVATAVPEPADGLEAVASLDCAGGAAGPAVGGADCEGIVQSSDEPPASSLRMPASSVGKNPPWGVGCAKSPSRPSLPTGLLSCLGMAPSRDRLAIHPSGRSEESESALGGAAAGAIGHEIGGGLLDSGDAGSCGKPHGFAPMDGPKDSG
jgi:hypothetical protein